LVPHGGTDRRVNVRVAPFLAATLFLLFPTLAAAGDPPPYPWTFPAETRKALETKVTLSFQETPVEEVLQFLTDFLEVKVTIDPAVCDPTKTTITFRVRDMVAWDAIQLVVERIPNACLALDAQGVHVVPAGKGSPRILDVRGLLDQAPAATFPWFERRLTMNLDGVPLTELIDFLIDLSGANIVLAPGLAAAPLGAVTCKCQDKPAGQILEEVCREHGLRWERRHSVLVLGKAAKEEPSALAKHKVSLDARGVTVPELVAALAKQGVEAVASPEAWSARGTLSLLVDEDLDAFVGALPGRAPLRAWIGTTTEVPHREVLVLDGGATSAEEVASVTCPATFPGVVSEIKALRGELAAALKARDEARATREIAAAKLHGSELAAQRLAARILAIARRAEAVHGATARHAELVPLVGKQDGAVRAAEAARAQAAGDRAAAAAAVRARNELRKLMARLDEAAAESALEKKLEAGARLQDLEPAKP
jgi:hypothetical protein